MSRNLALGALVAVLAPGVSLAQSTCRDDTVHLRGPWGQALFRVEVADTQDERSRGLMHREQMSAGAGMLFVFEDTAPVSFWMDNTLIPLDMVFVDEAGTVVHIHHQAKPLDRTPIYSQGAVRYVLEINGGMAKTMGLTNGTELRHPSILQEGAVWSCEGGT